MGVDGKWLAVYTKPRWEKKVYRLLADKGVEAYCPLNKVQKKWSDRIKVVEEPLFKSYVFVKVADQDQQAIRMTGGVVNFVYWLGKPAVIPDREIDTIKRFLDEYEQVFVEPIALANAQKVAITAGIFMHTEGEVIKVRGKKVQVLLDRIGYKLVAYIDKEKVRVLK